jgi:GMP synthase (glutamine-hydrolysing)
MSFSWMYDVDMKNILVLQFRLSHKAAQSECDDIRRAAAADDVMFTCVDVIADELYGWHDPAAVLAPYDGVIIGGSGDVHFDGGVPEDHQARVLMRKIMKRITPFVQYVFDHDVPTLGICLGHQIMAHVKGATVSACPYQEMIGTYSVVRMCDGSDPIFGDFPIVFDAQFAHKDSVRTLPPGVKVLARDVRRDQGGVLRYSKNIYSTQFHPELNLDAIADRMQHYPEYLPEGKTMEELFYTSEETENIIRRFVQLAEKKMHISNT